MKKTVKLMKKYKKLTNRVRVFSLQNLNILKIICQAFNQLEACKYVKAV